MTYHEASNEAYYCFKIFVTVLATPDFTISLSIAHLLYWDALYSKWPLILFARHTMPLFISISFIVVSTTQFPDMTLSLHCGRCFSEHQNILKRRVDHASILSTSDYLPPSRILPTTETSKTPRPSTFSAQRAFDISLTREDNPLWFDS